MMATTMMGGLCFGVPDVCKLPNQVPTPFPNLAVPPMGVPAVYNTLFMGAPAHNLATTIPMTNGDNAGMGLGLISPSVMGPSRYMTGAFTVLLKGMPAARMTSVTLTNRGNCPGAAIAPSQFKVLLLAP